MLDQSSHFAFGENWADFALRIDEKRVETATEALHRLVPSLRGRSFLDIGCGSGLSSLAALYLGAKRVLAIDSDEISVDTTRALLTKYAATAQWTAQQGSILESDPSSLGRFDVVYAWGVLHHTGAMWEAIRRSAGLVKSDGLLVLAIYGKSRLCGAWRVEKTVYSRCTSAVQWVVRMIYCTAFLANVLRKGGDPIKYVRDYGAREGRGMRWWNDVHDWLGGYPYESASVEEIDLEMRRLGFQAERAWPVPSHRWGVFGTGCHELVYRARTEPPDADSSVHHD